MSRIIVAILLLVGVYQAIAGVHIVCRELETDLATQYVAMVVAFALYIVVLLLPELWYAPHEEDW